MKRGARSQKDFEDRARNSTALAAPFTLLAAGGFAGGLPTPVTVVAGCVAVAALIAAWLFFLQAREAGQQIADLEEEREIAGLARSAPVLELGRVADPTPLGIDRAEQNILPGGSVPEYVSRLVDEELDAAIAAAFDGAGSWLVVVEGPSKVGKSRVLFEALSRSAVGHLVVAPRDAAAFRELLTLDDAAPASGC